MSGRYRSAPRGSRLTEVTPALGVGEGFDSVGGPRLRPARRPITLRHLLTHTANFSYDIWNPEVGQYVGTGGSSGASGGS
jgi:methyl acetate hydrolase